MLETTIKFLIDSSMFINNCFISFFREITFYILKRKKKNNVLWQSNHSNLTGINDFY